MSCNGKKHIYLIDRPPYNSYAKSVPSLLYTVIKIRHFGGLKIQIQPYFDVYGSFNEAKEQFEFRNSYSNATYIGDKTYTSTSAFMNFGNYNVENRERVKGNDFNLVENSIHSFLCTFLSCKKVTKMRRHRLRWLSCGKSYPTE